VTSLALRRGTGVFSESPVSVLDLDDRKTAKGTSKRHWPRFRNRWLGAFSFSAIDFRWDLQGFAGGPLAGRQTAIAASVEWSYALTLVLALRAV